MQLRHNEACYDAATALDLLRAVRDSLLSEILRTDRNQLGGQT